MAENRVKTIFQNLDKAISGGWRNEPTKRSNSYNIPTSNIIYKTDNKEDYESKKLELKQQKLLSSMWRKANFDLNAETLAGLTNVKLMYRDADLMDAFPEIGAALDIVAEESCVNNDKGHIINIYSKSERVKAILEDLFINRLDIHVSLPMCCRSMCKYGNNFMLLNINEKEGVMGWRQLPVYEIERYEDGLTTPYAIANPYANDLSKSKVEDVKFVWIGKSESIPFRNWQISHFRLLTDSFYLPYGVSYLNKARRHWRMLSLMEDMMLIYRLERSIERRVFKIYVGAIDDADVPAYVNEIANNFKRTPIVDPLTGQVDLRKNILGVDQDIFIPTRDENAPTPIDTLAAAQNLTAMDDIKFVQNKVLTALRIPKTFLNFEENAGDGKNLALMDIRFTRTINRIQQALIMELTKIATIHLYLLGFTDELTNFTITMNNPSTQAEILEIDNLQKKITVIKDAVSDPGNGIPIMSWTRALKEIMKWNDNEIAQNLEEIRLEKALASELEKTSQIIKRTGQFDNIDHIYGEPNAEYQEDAEQGNNGDGGDGNFGGGGGSFGGDLDNIDDAAGDTDGEVSGEEGEIPLDNATSEDSLGGNAEPATNEGLLKQINSIEKKLIKEKREKIRQYNVKAKGYTDDYLDRLRKNTIKENTIERVPLLNKSFFLNEEMNDIMTELDIHLMDGK